MTAQSNGTPIAILRGDKISFIKPLNEIPVENDTIYYHRLVQYGDKIVCVGNGTQMILTE